MSSLTDRPYCYWKFREAVTILAHSEAPLRKRIHWALTTCGVLRDEDLPEPLRETFNELRAQVTWKQDGDPREGTWANTLEAMSDEDAQKVAELFVTLFELSVDPDAENISLPD